MAPRRLTANRKDKLYAQKVLEQDHKCILCKMPFEKTLVWNKSCCFDHLNDKNKDDEDSNLAVVHRECNLIKRYNIEYKIIAQNWKKHLESQISLSQCKGEKKVDMHKQKNADELDEGNINLIVNKLALSQLQEFLPEDSKEQIAYSRILDNIHYRLIEQTGGRGSEQASRRALNVLVKSEYSDYELKKLGRGTKIVQRRTKHKILNNHQ